MESILLAAVISTSLAHPGVLGPHENVKELAAICFKTGEQTGGMKKICYYDCTGSAKAITIGAVELCPLTIND